MMKVLGAALLTGSLMLFASGASADVSCATDFNGDGVTNADDIEIFKSYLGSSEDDEGFEPAIDLDGDGEVTVADYTVFLNCN